MKYFVLQISDRYFENVGNTHKILSKHFNRIDDITPFNRFTDVANQNIKANSLKVSDRMLLERRAGQLGCFLSYVNILNYVIDNNLKNLLVLEDDAEIKDLEIFVKAVSHLDSNILDYDFVSFYNVNPISKKSNDLWRRRVGERQVDFGDSYFERSYPQQHSTVCTIFSQSGANKILNELQNGRGIYTPIDDFIFNESRRGTLNGYKIKDDYSKILRHIGLVSEVKRT